MADPVTFGGVKWVVDSNVPREERMYFINDQYLYHGPPQQETSHMVDNNELIERFRHHPPSDSAVVSAHQTIRGVCQNAAVWMNVHLPESREKSLALTALQEAMMWGNAAVAIHGLPGQGGEADGGEGKN